jgi:hypothetical protein
MKTETMAIISIGVFIIAIIRPEKHIRKALKNIYWRVRYRPAKLVKNWYYRMRKHPQEIDLKIGGHYHPPTIPQDREEKEDNIRRIRSMLQEIQEENMLLKIQKNKGEQRQTT